MRLLVFCLSFVMTTGLYSQNGTKPTQPRKPLALPDSSFYMVVEDRFMITGVGLAVTGKISTGKVLIGQLIHIKGFNEKPIEVKVSKIEMYGNPNLTTAKAGDHVGLLFASLKPEQIQRGMVVTQNDFGMITKTATVELTALSGAPKYENGSKVTVYINGVDIYDCVIEMDANASVSAGETKTVKINFPHYVTVIPKLEFAIRSRSFKTVGMGKLLLN